MSGIRELTIEVRALSPLLVGGQSAPRHGGDKGSARDGRDRPVIPASALRGALRIELERLLRGRDGDDAVCGANPEPDDGTRGPCDCPVCRLFGAEGHGIGTLRLEDAVLAQDAQVKTVVRSQVAVGRRSGSAVSGHLAFFEPIAAGEEEGPRYRARAHLVPLGPDEAPERLDEDAQNLRAACEALGALGGGKSRGLGWVACSVVEDAARPAKRPSAAPAFKGSSPVDLRLRFEARAPIHLGDGRPLGGFLPTRSSAPGSTVRGAVAFALLEQGLCSPDDERFLGLLDETSGARFGAARMAGDRPSLTRRRCRPNGHVFDDLIGEILRREAADRHLALAPRLESACSEPGCTATKVQPWRWGKDRPEPWRRVRTRTAINRRTGTAMDRKLYSVEVLEPWLPAGDGRQSDHPLELVADVLSASPGAAELLAKLDQREVWLGGRRSRGMGRCLLHVEEAPASDLEAARAAVGELTAKLRQAWNRLREVAGRPVEELLAKDEVLVALVLEEPWSPEEASEGLGGGPLGQEGVPGASALLPVHRFVEVVEEGRFGAIEASRYGAGEAVHRGEVEPDVAAAPGSAYVYRAKEPAVASHLAEWVALGRQGSGRNREIGWGRFWIRGAALDE